MSVEENMMDSAEQAAGADSNSPEIAALQAEIERLQQEVQEAKEQSLRVAAEMQNVRRRAEMDVEKAHKFGLEKFAKELLPALDGLEKAIEAEVAAKNEMTALREGVELTLSILLNGIRKFDVEQLDPVGQPFNPEQHEAMAMVDAPGAAPNTVVAAMQKGYLLNGRLLRPAMVVVAKS